jgi:putative endonuclease
MDGYYVYVLASQRNGTLYIGVTNDVARRVAEHKARVADSFTRKHDVTKLVHVERFTDINEAIAREKAMKKWRRAWKLKLIEQGNPTWTDLYETINA